MNRLLLAAALAGIAVTPTAAFAAQPLNVAATFSPNPPRRGTETITVILTDGARKPVNGARVSIATNMPAMSMTGPTLVASAKGNGRYSASVRIAFATRWAFVVVAKARGKTVTRTIVRDVK